MIYIYTVKYETLAVNAALWADYFPTEEVLNVCISIQNQAEFLLSVN